MNPEKLKAFAKEQSTKAQEMLDTVRLHHGQKAGDKCTLLSNMVSLQQQNHTLCFSMIAGLTRLEDPQPALACYAAFMSFMSSEKGLVPAVFQELFTEEERKTLIPFMTAINEDLGKILDAILDGVGMP